MATDDMKPEEERILRAMFGTDEGKLNISQITNLLQLPLQQTRYYLDKLKKEELIERQQTYSVTWGTRTVESYNLTEKGRAYVMENLMQNKTP